MVFPLAQNFSQILQHWLNEMDQYEPILYFDWDTFINLIQKEPLALTAVAIALANIFLVIVFKMTDHWREAKREELQRARLHIEIYPVDDQDSNEQILQVVLTNTGRETIVIRDIGYQKRPFIRSVIHHLSPLNLQPVYRPFERSQLSRDLPDVQIPLAIQAREFFEFKVTGKCLEKLLHSSNRFTVRDSLGTLWLYRGAPLSRFASRSMRARHKTFADTPPSLSDVLSISQNNPIISQPGMHSGLLQTDTNESLDHSSHDATVHEQTADHEAEALAHASVHD